MKNLFLFLIIISGLTSITAKEPARDGFFPLQVLNRYFAFDESQTAQLEVLLEARRASVSVIQEELRLNRQAIGEMINSEEPDPMVLGELMINGKELNDQVHATQEAFADGFSELLTEEQAQKYNSLVRAQRLQPVVRAANSIKLPLIPPEPPAED